MGKKKIYVDAGEDGRVMGWGSAPMHEHAVQLTVDDDHGVLLSPTTYLLNEDGHLIKNNQLVMEKTIQRKIQELSLACERTILGRFVVELDGMSYQFSNDMEAQMNFDKMDRAFEKERVTELPWTAYTMDGEVIRILLTPATFEVVYTQHLTHIQNNISKFRDFLMPLVMGSTSFEEVQSIHWDMSPSLPQP